MMVDFTYELPKALTDAQRADFINNRFTPCVNGEKPCKGLVVDMANGHLVKIVAFDDPKFMHFAVRHYVKTDRGILETIPPKIVEAMHRVAAYTGSRFTRTSPLEEVVSFMNYVSLFPATAYASLPLRDTSWKPAAYTTMPWMVHCSINTAAGVKLVS